MRRKVNLYIDGRRVDLGSESLILMTYQQEDLYNPTIVKNSYSQQLKLAGTPTNNSIFNDAFRLDRVSEGGFNPRTKTPFQILDELNNRLESGYVKLNGTTKKGASVEYSITLYGGLGSMFYDLSYGPDDSPLTLAALDFLGTATPADEFNYNIDRYLVANAWSVLAGEQQNDLFDVLNFAPAYNGIPGEFEANKAVFDADLVGASEPQVATLSRNYTEREVHDFRSYLQRPVLRVRAVLDAIVRFAAAKGYELYLQGEWFRDDNPYYSKLWMTLPLLEGKRSGQTIKKADILSGTSSPASFLISYCKTFGLRFICDGKSVTVLGRDEFFSGELIDLTDRVDLSKGESLKPLLMDAKYYELSSENKSAFAAAYKESYGQPYGCKRINTGYEFNADVKKLAENAIFRAGTQSRETSSAFRNVVRNESGGINKDFPAVFLEGATWGDGNVLAAGGQYTATWWDSDVNGYDFLDAVQLHSAENKAEDGSGVLLFFDRMAACPDQLKLTDDTPQMGEKPCWNVSNTNSRLLLEIPHFTRWLTDDAGTITRSLEWGHPRELNDYKVALADSSECIYSLRWARYLADRYDENTKVLTIPVNFSGMQVTKELLSHFYWYKGAVWTLNAIRNYSLTTYDPVDCEFIQIQDKQNYINGQS